MLKSWRSSSGHWAEWADLSVCPRSSIDGRSWAAEINVAKNKERAATTISFFHFPAVKKA